MSAYKGIRFFAKVAAGKQTSGELLIMTSFSAASGGICNSMPGKGCGDHLYCPIASFKTTWAAQVCYFADLVQQGWGLPQGTLDPRTAYGLQIAMAGGKDIDVWIDDVQFILK